MPEDFLDITIDPALDEHLRSTRHRLTDLMYRGELGHSEGLDLWEFVARCAYGVEQEPWQDTDRLRHLALELELLPLPVLPSAPTSLMFDPDG